MNIPEKNFCVPATINQYLSWADANDLHKFAFYGVLTGNWLKKPEEASFLLRDLLTGFLSSDVLRNLFYSTNSGLQSLLEEAFSKEKDDSIKDSLEYQSLSIQAEVAIADDMIDTSYSFVGVSNTKKKTCGRPETYDLAYEPLRNLLDFRVSFSKEVFLSDMRGDDESKYGYHEGFPNISLIDVFNAIFNDLTWGGYNDAEKKIEHDKLVTLLEDRVASADSEDCVFYTHDEVMSDLRAKINKYIKD